MKEQTSACQGREEGREAAGDMAGQNRWRAWKEGREEPHGESQWKEFLKGLDSPHVGCRKESNPWEDTKAFLASFEQVAQACQWPREEWAARLLPALSGEAQQAFSSLEARDRGDYGKVKAAILLSEANRTETLRQHFRQFHSPEVGNPRWIYSQLRDLCCRWLKPERHSKDQILELLILEQFLAVLPPELQSWIRAGGPENCTQAVALVEVFLINHQGDPEMEKGQGLLQEVGPISAEKGSDDPMQRKIYADAMQNTEGQIHFTESSSPPQMKGKGTKQQGHINPSLPPERQGTPEVRQTENQMQFGETDVVKQSRTEAGPRTMFWQVLHEDRGDVDSLEGFLVPKSGLASHLEEEEEMLVQVLEERDRLPGKDASDVKRIKEEDSEPAESGPCETQESLAKATQADIPGTSEIHKQRRESQDQLVKQEHRECLERVSAAISKIYEVNAEGGKAVLSKCGRKYTPGPVPTHSGGNPYECPTSEENLQQKCYLDQHLGTLTGGRKGTELKMENAWYGRREHEGTYRTVLHLTQRNMSETAEIQEPVCEPERQPAGASIETVISARPKQSLNIEDIVSDHHDTMHARENFHKSPMRGEDFSPNLSKHQRIPIGEKRNEFFPGKRTFLQKELLIRHQCRRTRKKTYECPECGKSLRSSGSFKSHQRIHTGERPYGCSYCAKSFNQSIHLERHQKVHTGEKPYECLACGRSFSRKDTLVKHQRTHAGHQHSFDCGS